MNPNIIKNQNNLDEPACEKLKALKLYHWVAAMQEDLKKLTPDQQNVLLTSINNWASLELAERHSRSIASRIRAAKFRKIQTVDTFDFHYNPSTKAIQSEYMTLFYETKKGKLPRAVFVGTAGLGKTHLSRSLGYGACQAKTAVLFMNTAQMLNLLATAKASHRLEAELNKYRKPKLLILDELGYVSMDMEASNLFFQVLSERHDEGLGTIATTNIPFGEWNQIFAGNAVAHAVVDRLTDDASVFYLEGESYREYLRKLKKKKSAKQSR